jgi:transmembrane sensor
MSAFGTSAAGHAIDSAALDWALRMAELDADWDAFTRWLEADAGHAELYDRAVIALAAATESVARTVPTPPRAANDPEPVIAEPLQRPTRGIWLAVAVVLVGLFGFGLWREQDRSYTIATMAGERRSIALAEGSSIELAGGSRLRLDRARPRSATLEAGEALFRVRHDVGTPFQVDVGGLALTDLGTVFDVRVLGARKQIAVGEGAVMVDPEGAALRLDPGQGVVADGDTLRRTRTDVADVGAWRDGRLAYDGATMAEVAEDLSRQLGWRITAAPAVAARIFNGTLETRALRDDPTLLGALLDVSVRRNGNGWTLDLPR